MLFNFVAGQNGGDGQNDQFRNDQFFSKIEKINEPKTKKNEKCKIVIDSNQVAKKKKCEMKKSLELFQSFLQLWF